VRVKLLAKLLTLEIIIVDDPDDPVWTENETGLGEIVKSGGVKMLIVEVTVLVEPLITVTVSE